MAEARKRYQRDVIRSVSNAATAPSIRLEIAAGTFCTLCTGDISADTMEFLALISLTSKCNCDTANLAVSVKARKSTCPAAALADQPVSRTFTVPSQR